MSPKNTQISKNIASEILKGLNEQQIPAVKHLDGPALVVAGPGSGKTRVLTHRIAFLILAHGVPETDILCVTFTNKAAGEIKERVERLLEKSGAMFNKLPWSGTFHSICSRILRKDGHNIGIPPSFKRARSLSIVWKPLFSRKSPNLSSGLLTLLQAINKNPDTKTVTKRAKLFLSIISP